MTQIGGGTPKIIGSHTALPTVNGFSFQPASYKAASFHRNFIPYTSTIFIGKLISLDKGCYVLGIFTAALFHADDMAILAPSMKGLMALLTVCDEYCVDWDVCLNAKKSKILSSGRKVEMAQDVALNGNKIEWVKEWVYLGVTLKSDKTYNCSITDRIRNFYRCANAIFRIDGRSNDTVMLHLVETHCIPILTYGIEVLVVKNRDERRRLRVAYNSVFRKIFDYRQ